jgi:hypothetical protein
MRKTAPWEDTNMTRGRRAIRSVLLGLVLVTALVVMSSGSAPAVDVGEAAPDFKLAASTGTDIALSDFKGKKFVFLEFYGSDFAPT